MIVVLIMIILQVYMLTSVQHFMSFIITIEGASFEIFINKLENK